MPAWEADDHDAVGEHLRRGVEQVAAAGADFFVCPDNTAHIVLEQIVESLPIPGLHIADVVAAEMADKGWRAAGLLGTRWTMTGPVYPRALSRRGLSVLAPGRSVQAEIDRAIFDELCQGVFRPETTRRFVRAIEELAEAGRDCVILGCTEIPLIIDDENSPLPVLDSTRLLATYAVAHALADEDAVGLDPARSGWIRVEQTIRK